MTSTLRIWIGLVSLMMLPACFVFQSSTDSVSVRAEYCEPIIDYCLIYPDTLQRVELLEEEHGIRLSMPSLKSQVVAKGFRNYIYRDMQGWQENEIGTKEAQYERVEVMETDYTPNYLRLSMRLDGRLHLVQVHRLDQERWVVVRLYAVAGELESTLMALFGRVDVIPGTID